MLLPKCRLCGERHALRDPHVYKDNVTKVRVQEPTNVTRVTKVVMGRPRRYESVAAKQRAYRLRKKQGNVVG